MMTESLVLCVAGAAAGLLLATGATMLVSRIQGTTIPLLRDVRVDNLALGFTVLVAVVTGIVFGLLPAIQASAQALPVALAEASRGSTSGRGGRVRRAIVVAEVAMACVLTTGAGLLIRSLARVLDVQPGFATGNVIAVRVDPSRAQTTRDQRNGYFDEVVRAVRSVPGVQALGLTDALPLGDNFGWRRWDTSADGYSPRDNGERIQPLVRMIDDGYFAAMKIPLHAGRAFTASR